MYIPLHLQDQRQKKNTSKPNQHLKCQAFWLYCGTFSNKILICCCLETISLSMVVSAMVEAGAKHTADWHCATINQPLTRTWQHSHRLQTGTSLGRATPLLSSPQTMTWQVSDSCRGWRWFKLCHSWGRDTWHGSNWRVVTLRHFFLPIYPIFSHFPTPFHSHIHLSSFFNSVSLCFLSIAS